MQMRVDVPYDTALSNPDGETAQTTKRVLQPQVIIAQD